MSKGTRTASWLLRRRLQMMHAQSVVTTTAPVMDAPTTAGRLAEERVWPFEPLLLRVVRTAVASSEALLVCA